MKIYGTVEKRDQGIKIAFNKQLLSSYKMQVIYYVGFLCKFLKD